MEGGESSRNSGSVGGLCVCEGGREQQQQRRGSERGELRAPLWVLGSRLLQGSSPANSCLCFSLLQLGLGSCAEAAGRVSRKVTHRASLCRRCPLPRAAPRVGVKPSSWRRAKCTFPTPISPHLTLDTQHGLAHMPLPRDRMGCEGEWCSGEASSSFPLTPSVFPSKTHLGADDSFITSFKILLL